MNHLIAKTKGKNGDFFKVISDEEIFNIPDDIENTIPFDANYKLEEDEWFIIEDFSETDFSIDILTRRFIAAEYDQIVVDDYKKIEYLCAYQTGIYFFQKLANNQLIQKKWFSISNNPTIVDRPIIVINNNADAIYIKNEDTLYFKRLSSISGIFKGIDILYREATQQETQAFLQNSFITLANNYNADLVKAANRKRIAMAMEKLANFTPLVKRNICIYIRGYCRDLPFDGTNSSFTITSEEDLKKLLYGLDEKYYTTQFGNEKRLANSIKTLE